MMEKSILPGAITRLVIFKQGRKVDRPDDVNVDKLCVRRT